MKRFKSCLGLLFFCVIPVAMAQAPSQPLHSLLSTFQSMRANFTQTTMVKKKVAKESRGSMALQRPGKFRWQITAPNRQIIIADGQYLWIYDVDLEQATKQSLSRSAHSPAMLLSGSTAALEQRFTLISSSTRNSQTVFHLKPKNDQDAVQQIKLEFKDKKLNTMSVLDSLGQQNIFSFSAVSVNPSLPASLFKFKAPKGVDIIQN